MTVPNENRSNGGRFFLLLLLALAGAFTLAMFILDESPQQLWGRILAGLASPPAPTPTPEPPSKQIASELPAASPAAPAPTPVPAPEQPAPPVPTPTPDPVGWILTQKERLPKSVVLMQATEFPVYIKGTAAGSVKIPAGSSVRLSGAGKDYLVVSYLESSVRVGLEATNFKVLAQREMEKAGEVAPTEPAPTASVSQQESGAPQPISSSGQNKLDYLDCLLLGNPASEHEHALTSFDLSKSKAYTGQDGQSARKFLPDPNNPYQGSYPGIYGGEISFAMKVNGSKLNYFTIKTSGEESYHGRLLLEIDGKELAIRHSNDVLFENREHSVSPGAFFYRTVPIPRSLTEGKDQVVMRIRSTGRFYLYGKPHDFPSYQRVLEEETGGIYRAYTHTNPVFALPFDDRQGLRVAYEKAPKRNSPNLHELKDTLVGRINENVNRLLKGNGDIHPHNNNNFNEVEMLATAYHTKSITAAYKNKAVVRKIRDAVDFAVKHRNDQLFPVSYSWGGAYGRPAYAVAMVFEDLEGLDEKVDLGAGADKTRREQWIEIFKESFEFGSTHRKTITNQEIEDSMAVYGAGLALAKLDPAIGSKYAEVGYHLLLEAAGVEDTTNLVVFKGGVPKLGDPKEGYFGVGYHFMTRKGTSHEPGWVSADCYGNLGGKLVEMYEMTQWDPVHSSGGQGDKRILEKARLHNLAQSEFSYASVDDEGYRCILTEGSTCLRNTYIPGKVFYGMEGVGGFTKDPVSLGYSRQMLADGQIFRIADSGLRFSSVCFLPDLLDTIAGSRSEIKMPCTPGEKDHVFSDEENAVVAIRRGQESLFIRFFGHIQKNAYAHYLTPSHERTIVFEADTREFHPSGKVDILHDGVGGPWAGEPPDHPSFALAGEQEEVPAYDHASATHGNRKILDFYQSRIGNYLVAINTTESLQKTIKFPPAMVGQQAVELVSGKPTRLPSNLPIGPLSTMVFYCPNTRDEGESARQSSMIMPERDKVSLHPIIERAEQLVTNEQTIKSCSISAGGDAKHKLLSEAVTKLTLLKYLAGSKQATTSQVEKAKEELTRAHQQLEAATKG